MSDIVKISALPLATTISGADYLPVVQGGITKRVLSSTLVNEGTPPNDTGLIGYWSMDGVPEYPTGTATYIQTEWATADGWTNAINGTATGISVSNGRLLFAAGTYGVFRSVADPQGKTFRFKLLVTAAGGTSGTIYANGTSINVGAISFVVGQEKVFDVTFPSGTPITNISIFRGDAAFAGSLDWIYIGDGSYAANSLLDNSGNGNHGQIFGATPVDGVSGKALIFDGVNDRCTYPTVRSLAKSMSVWVKFTSAAADLRIIQENFGASTGALFLVSVVSQKISFNWRQSAGAADSLTSASNYNDGLWHHVVATHTGTIASLYIDGVLVGSKSSAYYDIAPDALGFIGSNSVPSIFFPGTIDEPRIYNRALSADEVFGLYNSKRGADAMIRAITAVPLSIPVRDPNGFLANTDPISTTVSGNIGYQPVLDVASGGSLVMPAGSGSYYWNVLTYGATIGGNKFGLNAAATTVSGTASANCTVLLKRIL